MKKNENFDWYKTEIRELIRKNLNKIHVKVGDSYGIDVSYLHKMISEYAEKERDEAREVTVRMVLAGLIMRCEIEEKDSVSLEFLKEVKPEKLLNRVERIKIPQKPSGFHFGYRDSNGTFIELEDVAKKLNEIIDIING